MVKKRALEVAVTGGMLALAAVGYSQMASYPGATNQEGSELAAFHRARDDAHLAIERLTLLDRCLAQSPGNRPLLIERTTLLSTMGRPQDAAKDLKVLVDKDIGFPGVRRAQALCAHNTGAKREELNFLQDWAAQKRDPDPRIASWTPDPRLLEGQIAELKGDIKAAEDAWQRYLADYKGVGYYLDRGDFLLRNGQMERAVAAYQVVLEDSRITDLEFDGMTRVHQAAALWRWDKDDRAEATVVQALMDIEQWQKETKGRSGSFAPAVLMGKALLDMGAGSADEKQRAEHQAKVQTAMAALVKELDLEHLNCEEIMLAVGGGKLTNVEAQGRVSKIMKGSPYLEWALWAEVYLALQMPKQAEQMLQTMPKDTSQYTILAAHLKRASTAPSTTK
jgi:tetratricopeptide (TPR) repeat protein